MNSTNSEDGKNPDTGKDGATRVLDKHIGPLDWNEKCGDL
jgi:hypothetical protein